jgi:hypothetical protein
VRPLLVNANVLSSSIIITLMMEARFFRNVGSYKSNTAKHPTDARCVPILVTLMMEAKRSSETPVLI